MSAVTIAEAKEHLGIAATVTNLDAELWGHIEAAEGAIADRIGPLSQASVTVRVGGGGCRGLVLPVAIGGLTSVTSVTEAYTGGVVPMSDLHVDTKTGVITYNDGSPFNARAYDVAYTEGFGTVPEQLRLAVLELTRALWDSQRGGGTARIGSAAQPTTATTVTGADDDLPHNVARLIAPYRTPRSA